MTIKVPPIDSKQIIGIILTLISLISAAMGVPNGGSSINPAALSFGSSPATTATDTATDTVKAKDQIFNQINEYRKQNGLNPWTRSERLDAESQAYSDKIARTGNPKHDAITAGMENIYFATNSPTGAVNSWKNSAGHNKNLLSNTSQAGLGISRGAFGYYVVLRGE